MSRNRKKNNWYGDRQFWRSLGTNQKDYVLYYERLMELALSMFEWKNLPETVDARFLELCLLTTGCCLFFKDEVMGYLTLRTTLGDPLDVYQIPTKRMAYAQNGYRYDATEDDSVIIFNNMLHLPDVMKLDKYARILWDIDQTIKVNAHAQKTPVLIVCDESQRLTMQQLYAKYEGNEPFIFGNKNLLDGSPISALSTGAPYVCDKLYLLKTQYWNEALTLLGIPNTDMEKKERLVSTEAVNQNGATMASRSSRLYERKAACKKINEMFGLNIDVDYVNDINPVIGLGGDDIVMNNMEAIYQHRPGNEEKGK